MAPIQNFSSCSVASSFLFRTLHLDENRSKSKDRMSEFITSSNGALNGDSIFGAHTSFSQRIQRLLERWGLSLVIDDTWSVGQKFLEEESGFITKPLVSSMQDNKMFGFISAKGDYKVIIDIGELRPTDIKVIINREKKLEVKGVKGIDCWIKTTNSYPDKFHYEFFLPNDADVKSIASEMSSDGFLITTVPSVKRKIYIPVTHESITDKCEKKYIYCDDCRQKSTSQPSKQSLSSNVVSSSKTITKATSDRDKLIENGSRKSRGEQEIMTNPIHSKNIRVIKIQTEDEEDSTSERTSKSLVSNSSSSSASTDIHRNTQESLLSHFHLTSIDSEIEKAINNLLVKKSQKTEADYELVKVRDNICYLFALDLSGFIPEGEMNVAFISNREIEVKCCKSESNSSSKAKDTFIERLLVPEDILSASVEAFVVPSKSLLVLVLPKRDRVNENEKSKEVVIPTTFEDKEAHLQEANDSIISCTSCLQDEESFRYHKEVQEQTTERAGYNYATLFGMEKDISTIEKTDSSTKHMEGETSRQNRDLNQQCNSECVNIGIQDHIPDASFKVNRKCDMDTETQNQCTEKSQREMSSQNNAEEIQNISSISEDFLSQKKDIIVAKEDSVSPRVNDPHTSSDSLIFEMKETTAKSTPNDESVSESHEAETKCASDDSDTLEIQRIVDTEMDNEDNLSEGVDTSSLHVSSQDHSIEERSHLKNTTKQYDLDTIQNETDIGGYNFDKCEGFKDSHSENNEDLANISCSNISLSMMVEEKGLFREDDFFNSVQLEFLEEMRKILSKYGKATSADNELASYRALRDSGLEEENWIALFLEDDQQYKIILDIAGDAKLEKYNITLLSENKILIKSKALSELQGNKVCDKILSRGIHLPTDIDVTSVESGISADGFLLILANKLQEKISHNNQSSSYETETARSETEKEAHLSIIEIKKHTTGRRDLELIEEEKSCELQSDDPDTDSENDDTSSTSTVVGICNVPSDDTLIDCNSSLILGAQEPLGYSVTLAESPCSSHDDSIKKNYLRLKISGSNFLRNSGRDDPESAVSIHTIDESDTNSCDESFSSSIEGFYSFVSADDYAIFSDDSHSLDDLQGLRISDCKDVLHNQTKSDDTLFNLEMQSEGTALEKNLQKTSTTNAGKPMRRGSIAPTGYNGFQMSGHASTEDQEGNSFTSWKSSTSSQINKDGVRLFQIIRKGLFFEDSFFSEFHDLYEATMRKILMNISEAGKCNHLSDIQTYRCLRKQNPTPQNQAFHIHDDQHSYKVLLDIENLKKNSIMVYSVEDKELVIQGKTKRMEGTLEPSATYRRHFPLPKGVDLDATTVATSEDGVLLIVCSKDEAVN